MEVNDRPRLMRRYSATPRPYRGAGARGGPDPGGRPRSAAGGGARLTRAERANERALPAQGDPARLWPGFTAPGSTLAAPTVATLPPHEIGQCHPPLTTPWLGQRVMLDSPQGWRSRPGTSRGACDVRSTNREPSGGASSTRLTCADVFLEDAERPALFSSGVVSVFGDDLHRLVLASPAASRLASSWTGSWRW